MPITDKQKETLCNKYIKSHNCENPSCLICGKKIESVEESEYVKTKRGTEIWIHKKCVKDW